MSFVLKEHTMLTQILILIAGLALVTLSADWLVDGSSAIARKAGISEFVIGMTIVGIGTSLPELVVSLSGALQGKADIAIGNIVGSNLFNVYLILGLTALIFPVGITKSNFRRDIPLNIAASILLVVLGMSRTLFCIGSGDTLSRTEGIVFLIIFVGYLYLSLKKDQTDNTEKDGEEAVKESKLVKDILLVTAGLAGLIFGGKIFVNSACEIARMAGLSEKFIAVTILAAGTSLPELVTCIVAAAKKKDQLALGNILGSNISNIFLILGCSAVCFHKTPGSASGLSFSGMSNVDIGFFVLSSIMILVSALTEKKGSTTRKIGRFDGALFLICEGAYMTYLIMTI